MHWIDASEQNPAKGTIEYYGYPTRRLAIHGGVRTDETGRLGFDARLPVRKNLAL